jgi:predicted transcriptional regulator
MSNWKLEAERLFFMEHKTIGDIGEEVGKTRKTISVYLQTISGFEAEKERRKLDNRQRRVQYKRVWQKAYQEIRREEAAAMLKRQHNIDAAVLSYERI